MSRRHAHYTILRGFVTSLKVGRIRAEPSHCFSTLSIRGWRWFDMRSTNSLLRQVGHTGFGRLQVIRLFLHGSQTTFVLVDEGERSLVGIDHFYFNERDIKASTIHEGFIGVLPELRGQGLATELRTCAIEHFRKSGLKGISTRISTGNAASLRSAEKLGFRVIEAYWDDVLDEDRLYLQLRW